MTLYHVCPRWDGNDLVTLADKINNGELTMREACRQTAVRFDWSTNFRYEDMEDSDWDDEVSGTAFCRYLDYEAGHVHCHATESEAREWRDLYLPSADLLAIEADTLRVASGEEYPHPVLEQSVDSALISLLN